ncbi:transcriptional regulator [Pseudoalteromonas lipolytica SCSIO 04301]|mgnify:CR=1 FL=1|uniref:WYL domain-containing protein n=1 Tax=Pseudoalteromonas TaxID=53246 RepID=UPI00044BA9BF|nr:MULTISPECIES: WYL domain-containing protein [Pseudoalteromonas]EWH06179.1 transcriptional regulator [Pseudoalteromonas lipolytica SCSIO 04301]QMW16177.1 WYL domain-containing protein [Pseudoalteromonas sp. MT33b]|tara:strand:- start:1427 stop:2311 length:885 start_codon:yes stop_codon:yes gene_type:complete
MSELETKSHSVKERLRFIELTLLFRGWIIRKDIVDKFETSMPAATRDLKAYNDLAPGNMSLDKSTKKWVIELGGFNPIFPIERNTALSILRNSEFAQSIGITHSGGVLGVPRISAPSIDVLAHLTRAVANGEAVLIEYCAASRGVETTEIVPHSFVDNGTRWHIRSYDKARGRFWDFVIGRIMSIKHIDSKVLPEETYDADYQWNRMVRLELIPHPSLKNLNNKKALEYEYGMENGQLTIQVRAAVAGYWLRMWNVDSSTDHSLDGKQYQLYLKNPETLYDVENALLAPGYNKP